MVLTSEVVCTGANNFLKLVIQRKFKQDSNILTAKIMFYTKALS